MIIQYFATKFHDTITTTEWGWVLMSVLIILWALTQAI